MIRTVVGLGMLAVFIGLSLIVAQWLIGWRPRFGLEAEFQRVIREAQVSEHYRGADGGGWDSQDVTDQICDSVDSALLNDMGIPVDDRKVWGLLVDGSNDKPQDIWRIYQDKGAIAACRDRSARFLEIGIHRQTLTCSAKVRVRSSCDL